MRTCIFLYKVTTGCTEWRVIWYWSRISANVNWCHISLFCIHRQIYLLKHTESYHPIVFEYATLPNATLRVWEGWLIFLSKAMGCNCLLGQSTLTALNRLMHVYVRLIMSHENGDVIFPWWAGVGLHKLPKQIIFLNVPSIRMVVCWLKFNKMFFKGQFINRPTLFYIMLFAPNRRQTLCKPMMS